MNRSDKLPLGLRCKLAASAAFHVLRGDYAIPMIPGKDRQPGLCRSLGECFRTCSQRDQAATLADELLAELGAARARAAHPSNPERTS
jgi:hypothetical protein